jgi:hypothetical protein
MDKVAQQNSHVLDNHGSDVQVGSPKERKKAPWYGKKDT